MMNPRDLDNHITGHYGEDFNADRAVCQLCGTELEAGDMLVWPWCPNPACDLGGDGVE